jgi:hypothetical protein
MPRSNPPENGNVRPDEVSLALIAPLPAEMPVGSAFGLKLRAFSPAGDLRGGRIELMADDEVLASRTLGELRDGGNETGELAVTAPGRLGTFNWRLVFPRQEIGGNAYPESTLPLAFRTRPHQTSLAVWDVPSPVLVGTCFCIKVGAKSSGECALAGARIEIRDAGGARLGLGTLGETALPGTSALYFAEIELTAPTQEGTASWIAAFAADDTRLPHNAAAAPFGIVAVKPPAHRLTVTVTETETHAPVENVQIGFGPYRAATDADGRAELATAAGSYELSVWKPDFEASPVTLDIAKDTRVEVALTPLPKERTAWD